MTKFTANHQQCISIAQKLEVAEDANEFRKGIFLAALIDSNTHLLFFSPPCIGSYIPEGFHTSCTFDYLSVDLGNLLFNSGMYFFAFLCPVAVIIFSYAGIVKAVYESEALEDLSSSRRHRCSQPETAQSKLTVDMLTHN